MEDASVSAKHPVISERLMIRTGIVIFLDGGGMQNSKGQFRVPMVFDNLIAKKEIPPLVGLFINPGEVPPVAPGARGRSTRSFEYDTPDDACARFFIDEMIPAAAQHA